MATQKVYMTWAGQRWDQISFALFSNEYYADDLLGANPQFIYQAVFGQGIFINIPLSLQSSVVSITTQAWGAISRLS